MADVVPSPFQTNSNHWGTPDTTAFDLARPEQMTHRKAFQYPPPPPPQSGAEMDHRHSGYAPEYTTLPTPHEMDPMSGVGSNPQERGDSFAQSMKLTRSQSTPMATHQQAATSLQQLDHDPSEQDSAAFNLAAEKRRNKLGYHRTSVACGK